MDDNPYQAPQPEADDDLAASLLEFAYFQTDSRYLTLREYWRLSSNPVQFLVAAAVKLLRIRLPMNFAFAGAGSTRGIDREKRSAPAQQALAELERQAAECGLRYVISYELPSVGAVASQATAYCNEDGTIIVPLVYVRTWTRVVLEKSVFALLSLLSDGRVLVTSGCRQELDVPPGYLAEFMPRASLATVLQRHRQRLHEVGVPAVASPTDMDVARRIRENEQRVMDFHIARGSYVLASPAEVARLRRLPDPATPAVRSRSTAFQGWEFICLSIVLLVFVAMSGGSPLLGNPPWRVAVLGLVAGLAVAAILAIWIYRALENRRNRR